MDVLITKKGEKNGYITLDNSKCLVLRRYDGEKTELIKDMTNEFDVYADDDGTLDIFGVNTSGNLLHIRHSNEDTTVYTVLENRSAEGRISAVRVFKIYGRYHLLYCINHTERLLVHHIAGYGDYSMEPEIIDRIGKNNLFDAVCDEDKNIHVVYAADDALLKRRYNYSTKTFSNPQTLVSAEVRSVGVLLFKGRLYSAFAALDKGHNSVFIYSDEAGTRTEVGIKVHMDTKVALVPNGDKLCVQWVENSMCFGVSCDEDLVKERVKIFGRTKGLARPKAIGGDVRATMTALDLSQRPFFNVEDMTVMHEKPRTQYTGQEVDMLSRKYIEVLSRKNDFVDLDRELTRIEAALERLVMLAEKAIEEIKGTSNNEKNSENKENSFEEEQ